MMAADAIRCRKSGGAAAGHKWWRLKLTDSPSSLVYKYQLAEVEFRSEISGQSESVGGLAIESGHYGSNKVANLFSGDDGGSWWTSPFDSSYDHWVGYEHPAPIECVQVMVMSYAGSKAPTEFTVQYSDDGLSWVDVASFSVASWSNSQKRAFTLS